MSTFALVIRTHNHAACIGETLRRVHEQNGLRDLITEIVQIDVGSSDGTVGVLKQYQPDKLVQLEPGRFTLGATLNLAMQTTHSPWVIFLAGDAWPRDEKWLAGLMAGLNLGNNLAAVTSRQEPHRGCRDVFAHSQNQRFGPGQESRLLGAHHNVVATAINREVWETHPFREDLPGCEAEEWASRVESLGWAVRLSSEAVVVHSRNLSLMEVYQRARKEALAWARVGSPAMPRTEAGQWLNRKFMRLARACWMDLKYSFEKGNILEWPFSICVQLAKYMGEQRGYREATRKLESQSSVMAAKLGSA